jgi:hypothetical protein
MQYHKGKYWIISWEDYKKLKLKLYSTDGIQHFTQYCKTQKDSFTILMANWYEISKLHKL